MDEETEYIFEKRIVIFLDVLGFKSKLFEFENEADKSINEDTNNMFISRQAVNFIECFNSNVKSIKETYGDKWIFRKAFSDEAYSNYNLLVKKACENYRLNIFGTVITRGELEHKLEFLSNYRDIINNNLLKYSNDENLENYDPNICESYDLEQINGFKLELKKLKGAKKHV